MSYNTPPNSLSDHYNVDFSNWKGSDRPLCAEWPNIVSIIHERLCSCSVYEEIMFKCSTSVSCCFHSPPHSLGCRDTVWSWSLFLWLFMTNYIWAIRVKLRVSAVFDVWSLHPENTHSLLILGQRWFGCRENGCHMRVVGISGERELERGGTVTTVVITNSLSVWVW